MADTLLNVSKEGLTENQRRIGARLKAYREERGFTASYAAGKLDIAPSAISKMENGQQVIPASLLFYWCQVLNISYNQAFLGWDRSSGDGEAFPEGLSPKHYLMVRRWTAAYRQSMYDYIERQDKHYQEEKRLRKELGDKEV